MTTAAPTTVSATGRLQARKRQDAPTPPKEFNNDELVWLEPVKANTALSIDTIWRTECQRYAVHYQQSRHGDDVRYVATYKRTVTQHGGGKHTFEDLVLNPKTGGYYPKEFKTLEAAMIAAEEKHCERTHKSGVRSNRAEVAAGHKPVLPPRPPREPREPGDQRPAQPARGRTLIFNFPVTAVLRWMGANRWSNEDAMKAMAVMGIAVAETTVKIQVKAGKDKDPGRGPPAALSEAEENELWDTLEK